jgi:hypothetical protein
MVDIIGKFGCGLNLLFLDYFIRLHSLFQPLSIAVMRFIFVVQNKWLKTFGVNKVINTIIVFSILLPGMITFSVQFPVFDFSQGPFNYCLGRFEIYFNPKHSDPFTPGKIVFI